MKPRGEVLEWVAGRIADRTPIDWEGLQSCSSAAEKQILKNAHILERLTRFHSDHEIQGRRWGHLVIRQKIDEGRFGEVFKAWDATLERVVALKLYRSEVAARIGEEEVLKEGRLLARIDHPHIVTVHGADQHEGRSGLWMQYVDGRTLEQRLFEKGTFSVEETLESGLALCEALGAIHQEGMLHRDVKAQNVMQETGGRIILMDFGLGTDQEWVTRYPAGTPLYMSPELFQKRRATTSSDLYALGVLLFHLLTGDFPVTGEDIDSLRRAHEHGSVKEALEKLPPDLPRGFRVLLSELLHPDRTRRPDADTLQSRLLALRTSREAGDQTDSALPRSAGNKPASLKRRATAATLVAVTLLLALAWHFWPGLIHQAHLWRGRQNYESGEISQAIAATQLALDIRRSLQGLVQLASFRSAAGEEAEAFQTLQQAFQKREQGSPLTRHRIAGQYLHESLQYGQALDEYRKVVTLNPNDAFAWRQIAQLQDLLRETSSALTSIGKAIRLEPDSIIHQGQRLLFLAALDPQEALSEISTLISSFSQAQYFYWSQGMAHLNLGQYSQALDSFRSLEKGDSEFRREARLHQARCQILLGRFQEAQATLDKASRDSGFARAQRGASDSDYFSARLAAVQGDADGALLSLRRLTSLPLVPRSLRRLRDGGILALQLQDKHLALELRDQMEKILDDQDSDVGSAYFEHLNAALTADSSPHDARDLLVRTLRTWSDPSLLFSLARLQQSTGDCQGAINSIKLLREDAPKLFEYESATLWTESYLIESECLAKMDRTDAAQSALDRFIESWPLNSLAPQLRSQAESLIFRLTQK